MDTLPAADIKIQATADLFPFYKSSDISEVKKNLNFDQKKLKDAYARLETILDAELPKISAEVIPVVDFSKITKNDGKFDNKTIDRIRKRGIVIIKNVIGKDEALKMHDDIVEYLEKTGQDPHDEDKTWYSTYWSKPQIKARHHENMIKVQNALLSLWSTNPDLDDSVNSTQPLTYNDRLRIRKPSDKSCKLRPHWDGGSLSRWADSKYRETYRAVFDGEWENLEPFCVQGRGLANMDEHCSFFRAFQGWTSLTTSGPGDGTLRVLPLLKEVIAHVMMRPLLDDIPENMIPGYKPKKLYYLTPQIHSKLIDAMVSIPEVNPGDSVWWHCDLVHAVEEIHQGKQTNAVLYIPVGPDCPINRKYVEKAKECFLSGKCPPDFNSSSHSTIATSFENDCEDRATLEDLNDVAKMMMGFKN